MNLLIASLLLGVSVIPVSADIENLEVNLSLTTLQLNESMIDDETTELDDEADSIFALHQERIFQFEQAPQQITMNVETRQSEQERSDALLKYFKSELYHIEDFEIDNQLISHLIQDQNDERFRLWFSQTLQPFDANFINFR